MFENMTYVKIMERALNRIPNDVDKRQGSIIWDALAPACSEIAEMYIELDNILNITYAETSFDQWLDKRCSEMGVYREPATNAVRLGTMYGNGKILKDIPIGSRFSIKKVNYYASEKQETGKYKLVCEEPGKVGNQLYGRLIPIENIEGLSFGEISDLLIPGEEKETDESLYERYVLRVNSTPFGGNIDDYKQKVKAIEGVYDCKVFPVWQGGGTVKITIIDTEYRTPTQTLVEKVQQTLDPIPFNQQGMGLAPIGHLVKVLPVGEVLINITTKLVLKPGWEIGQIKPLVEAIIEDYLLALSKDWAKEEYLIVRINQLEAKILSIDGIVDISDTTLNTNQSNIILDKEEIPIAGLVMLN